VRDVTEAYERYRFNEAATAIYHFLWSDLADWYIELIKPRLYGDVPGGDVARAVAAATFETALRLLHPIMPFVTEALWQRLPARGKGTSLSTRAWPGADSRAADPAALRQFALVQELIGAIRSIRAEYNVAPGHPVRVLVAAGSAAAAGAFQAERSTIIRMARLSELTLGEIGSGSGAAAVLSDGTAAHVPLGDMVDLEKECGRLHGERARLDQLIQGQVTKLANEQFVSRAPAEVVNRERQKLADWKEQVEVLAGKLEGLGCR
jgi:valyl-tRNA synthetase